MLDAKRPGRELAKALAAEQVYVGRVWPAWPNHVRVTVGTPEEMARFQSALARVFRA
jgi:histidinol-phosphate/aromatic aminotransferase/cobyric acid decarboxylase-like protein